MNLLFRADASVTIGTGHAMRCLALVQAWQDSGGNAVCAMAETTPAIQARLTREGCEILAVSGGADDARQTIGLAREQKAEWIVIDGYQFNADYQRALKAAGCKTLFLDDYGHASHYSADLVLNQSVGADEMLYARREPYTRLLLGPSYALLRREFTHWQDWNREIAPIARRLLVMMGGSDPGNVTARAIEALAQFQDLQATVIVGGSNPHLAQLEQLAERAGRNIELLKDVSNVPELMAAADLAISAAGSTCWELCLLGLPALLFDIAGNQTALARELDRQGCAVHIGDQTTPTENIARQLKRLLDSYELRQLLSQRSRKLVDGKGAARVVSVLRSRELCEGEGLQLRRARSEDSRLLWEWANDRQVRAGSFSSAPISWETHTVWLEEKLGHDGCLLFIAEDEHKNPCGQIRFDARRDGDWEVGVSVARSMRGRRLASRMIALGLQALRSEHAGVRVHAFVKLANVASIKAFERVGFMRIGTEEIRGSAALHLIVEDEKLEMVI